MINKIPLFLLLFCGFCVLSCKSPTEQQAPDKVLTESFSFQSTIRPDVSWTENLVNNFNAAAREEALKNGQDSVMQFQTPKKKRPVYRDIAFFPVLSAKKLEELSNSGFGRYTKNKHLGQIGSIDFKKNFVLIVGHPIPKITYGAQGTSGYAAYFDEVSELRMKNGKLTLKLDCSKIGSGASGMQALMQKWKSSVYVVSKNNCDTLLVELYEDIYPFSLVAGNDSIKK